MPDTSLYNAVYESIKRRPQTEEDLILIFGAAAHTALRHLLNEKKVMRVALDGKTFFKKATDGRD